MDALDRIVRFFEGTFEGLDPESVLGEDVTSDLATAAGVSLNDITLPEVTAVLDEMLSRGEVLRALTLLKVLSEVDPEGSHLLILLSHILEVEIGGRLPASFADPLATEFLGSDRPHIAWSTLRRDTLEFLLLPEETDNPGPDCWLICRGRASGGDPASAPVSLVWRTTLHQRSRSRVIGARRAPRSRVHLPAKVIMVGRVERTKPAPGYSAVINDLSVTGAGLVLPNPHGVLQASEMMQRRVRLEIPLPTEGQSLSTLADVHWCRPDPQEGNRALRIGLHFSDPPESFVQAVREWITQRKGERHFLWNLWDTVATKP